MTENKLPMLPPNVELEKKVLKKLARGNRALAVIHYQFESIHPFCDGNGRTGRIINVLFLVLQELLDSPILYLSSFIIRNKSAYYKLLQEVRTEGNWEA